MKVFLGGTCSDSKWRDEIEPLLDDAGLEYFNPVVDDWNEEVQKKEIQERQNCDFCLYTITPKMEGVYSIFEVADDSNKRPQKTILVVLEEDGGETFSKHQKKSMESVKNGVKSNGAKSFDDLNSAVKWMQMVLNLLMI